jgi:hypothetical protein
MRRGLILLGIALLVLSGIVYAGGFFYGLTFAYSDDGGPVWYNVLFPVALGVGGLGALALVVGLVVGRRLSN